MMRTMKNMKIKRIMMKMVRLSCFTTMPHFTSKENLETSSVRQDIGLWQSICYSYIFNYKLQGEVDLKIVYDDDVYGARILAELPTAAADDEGIVCNHLIAMQTVLAEDRLEWSALDFSSEPPTQRTFRVEFEDVGVSSEFKDMFAEGDIFVF